MFLNMNWITHEELEHFKKQGNLTASCLLAFKQLMGLGCDPNPEAGIQSLKDLARTRHIPLANWLLGRAYHRGDGVKPDPDLGLKYIFQAATSLQCPQAMLFMNRSFPLKKTHPQGKPRFQEKVQELREKVALLEEHHQNIKREDKYNDIFDLDFELSSFLHSLLNVKPGFMLSADNLSPDLIRMLKEIKDPQFITVHDGCVTLEEENVKILSGTTSFLKQAEDKINKSIQGLRLYIEKIEGYLKDTTEKLRNANGKDQPKLQGYLESYKRKLARSKEDIGILETIRGDLKDLFPSTAWDRDNTFIEKYSFMEG